MTNVSLDNTLGAFVIGASFANILFGITCLQSSFYYRNYPNDGWIFKASVGIIWVLDTIDVAVTTHVWYFYSIKNFGNFQAFTQGNIVWSFKLHILICVSIRVFVQAVYALRLWKLGHHLYQSILWLVILVTASNAGCGIYLVKDVFSIPSFSQTPTIRNALISLFAMSISAEFILSVAMMYTLNKGRTSSVFPNTIAILLTLMQMVLISGLVTSLYSMLILVTFLLWPDTLIFLGVDCIQPKIFINSLLAMLNARNTVRNIDDSFHLPIIDSVAKSVHDHRAEGEVCFSISI
ncbi:uncharacterized protein BT62DRAFT_546460 [Guyanagaster necrorhizus]|uniref:DUF6534 domain-containing protein n=1 Tax=Guyanagaster necrorhizus TaxID=856835 RepID=A0A9P7VHP4_9AGAR|nr:uncharacterized protein BT62DRAFT_546460 [Guyanagaster necrorhizus MCA 3950]KAG7441238.1 hypothetical protein BT62DRAFT_546460 [Guyanagaster necrorhizus MCA 3950]